MLWVGIGGFIGAILRFLISDYIGRASNYAPFPYGTLTVNLLGCLLIGFLLYLAVTQGWFTAEIQLLLVTGLLGALTTFSTFGLETVSLVQRNLLSTALANVGLHLLLGLSAVWLGEKLAATLFR